MNKKILIATGIYPPDIGGPATIVPPLFNELKNRGFDCKILTYSDVTLVSEEKNYLTRVLRSKSLSRLIYFWHMIRLSIWADLVYVTDVYSVGYFAYLTKKFLRKKYIVRFAGDAAWETAVASGWTSDYIIDFQKNKYNSKIERLKNRRAIIMKNADKVIAVSNFMFGVAQNIGVDEKNIKVIYNAVDFTSQKYEDLYSEIKERYKGKKIILTSCRLTPWKGVDQIIKTIPDIKKGVGGVVFLIAGDGPERKKLEELADKMNLKNEVVFLGKIDYLTNLNYMRAADVFVLNTNYEGLSHTLLEAMTAGVPIVATDVGGNPETITTEKEGILVPYNDSQKLSDAIVKILTNTDLVKKLSDNAREKVKQFNWNKTISETVSLIEET